MKFFLKELFFHLMRILLFPMRLINALVQDLILALSYVCAIVGTILDLFF